MFLGTSNAILAIVVSLTTSADKNPLFKAERWWAKLLFYYLFILFTVSQHYNYVIQFMF